LTLRNAAKIKDIRRMEKISNETHRAEIDYLCASMATIPGRAWFHSLLSRCHLFDSSYFPDRYLAARVEGERNIGLAIYNDIVTHCPDQFITMMREATIQEITNDRRHDTLDPDDPDLDDPSSERPFRSDL
jgi:hypothetical protein